MSDAVGALDGTPSPAFVLRRSLTSDTALLRAAVDDYATPGSARVRRFIKCNRRPCSSIFSPTLLSP